MLIKHSGKNKKKINMTNGLNLSLSPKEMRILLQSGLMFAMLAICVIMIYPLQPPFNAEQTAVLDFWNILICGINPFLYITLNS